MYSFIQVKTPLKVYFSKGVFRQFDVFRLGDVAEIEAQMFSFAQKFNRRTTVEFSTEPAILPNCWLAVVHRFSVVIVIFVHFNWIFFKIVSCNEFCC